MKNVLFFVCLCCLVISCGTTKKIQDNTTSTVMTENVSGDGSSFEKAVVINKSNENDGIAAEYDWLKKNYPGYQSLGQGLSFKDKKAFDVIKIKTTDGMVKSVYFDISKFFGKF
jgi:hypothetical protein